MNKRRTELLEISSYIQTIDNDVTMILQSLQWDRKHLIEALPMTPCRHDHNHRVPPDKLEDHEKECYLRSLGYSNEDLLLPEPLDASATTLVTLNKNDIENIIDYAAKIDPAYRKGVGPGAAEPQSLARLQQAYSADERRALHDAVVAAAPATHDLTELALLSVDGEPQGLPGKSRAAILAELRDMKRRRTKYRGAAKTRNYSDVLRGVIATQMEHYSGAQNDNDTNNSDNINKSNTEKPRDIRQVKIKKEPFEDDNTYSTENESRRHRQDNYRDGSRDERRHREKSRDETHKDRSRDKYKERDKHQEYKRDMHRDDRRYRDYRDDRDRHSRSNKERSRRNDYRSDKYREDTRDSRSKDKYHKSSNSEVRHKREDCDSYEKSYREEKHKRYYDYKHGELETHKRIKQEKD